MGRNGIHHFISDQKIAPTTGSEDLKVIIGNRMHEIGPSCDLPPMQAGSPATGNRRSIEQSWVMESQTHG
jgi:hypothetical protein